MNTEERIKKLVAQMCSTETVENEDFLKEDLGLDSLSIVELIARIEDAFQIRFEIAALNPDELLSVEDLVVLVNRAL